jgi:hypothetical protein
MFHYSHNLKIFHNNKFTVTSKDFYRHKIMIFKILRTIIFVWKIRSKASYVHCPGAVPLSGATVGQLIRTAAEKWPIKEALISAHQDIRLTFQDIHTKVI